MSSHITRYQKTSPNATQKARSVFYLVKAKLQAQVFDLREDWQVGDLPYSLRAAGLRGLFAVRIGRPMV